MTKLDRHSGTAGLWRLLICGVAALALGAAVAPDSRALATIWLLAAVHWSSLPLGALCLLMMMRVIPGVWRVQLAPAAASVLLLLPLGLLMMLPILLSLGSIYPWANAHADGIRYLAPLPFGARTLAFYAFAMAIAALLLLRPAWSFAAATGGLIVFVLADTLMAVDWVMSLDPEFHSSGFGLYFLSIQTTTALAALVALRLFLGTPVERISVLGALLLTAILLSAYFAFMQYIIIWSTNLPQGVAWYGRRSTGFGGGLLYAFGILQFVPAILLMFPPVRRNARRVGLLALALLAGKALEMAWLVLPASPDDLRLALAALLVLGGSGFLVAATWFRVRDLAGGLPVWPDEAKATVP